MHANGIKEQTTTTGTGDLTVASASGFVRFSEWYATGTDNPFPYTILDASGGPIEGGIGYLSGTNTLVRTKVICTYASPTYNQATPSAVSLASGTKYVICSSSLWQMMLTATNYGMQYSPSTGANRSIQNHLSTFFSTGANSWTLADRMHYWMFYALEGAIIDGIVVSGVTNASSYKLGFGIYTIRTDGRPGRRLVSVGQATPTASSAPQIITFSGSAKMAMSPGPYWFGAVVSNTGLTFDKETCRPFHMGSERASAAPTQGFVENISSGFTDVPSTAGASIGEYPYAGGYTDHMCVGVHIA